MLFFIIYFSLEKSYWPDHLLAFSFFLFILLFYFHNRLHNTVCMSLYVCNSVFCLTLLLNAYPFTYHKKILCVQNWIIWCTYFKKLLYTHISPSQNPRNLSLAYQKKNPKTKQMYHWNWPPLGWFNSLAGIVKRRFASYVKSHLATSSGDGSKKDREPPPHYGHPLQPTSPYHFEKLRQIAPTSSSMPSSPHFGHRSQHYEKDRMAAHSPRILNNIDRRHRSPDPPPR